MRRYLLVVVIVLAIASPTVYGARRARRTKPQSKAIIQQKLRAVQQRKLRVQQELRRARALELQAKAQLHQANVQVNETKTKLNVATTQLEVSQDKLHDARVALERSERKLDQHQRDLSERLDQIYESGETGLLEVLFQASSLGDLENRLYVINEFVDTDANLLNNYEQAREKRADARQIAAAREREVAYLREQASQQHEQAAEYRESAAAEKERYTDARQRWEQALAQLEQDSRQLGAMLARWRYTPTGRKWEAKTFSGGFVMPVSGHITSGFGYRMHPILKYRRMHTGVDIAAPSGTPIHAAASGVVFSAGRRGGYGNCIVLIHGSSIATLYGHCSSLAVSAGQEVKKGQVIGYVGSTGLSTGPHLHFEKRINGNPVSPGI
jgi:murein DD-endopeptidase MepM/ murein hydrolase activator NlpD